MGNNLYAYCNNNPVNMVDPDGESILITLSALATILAKAIVVTAVVTYVVSGIGHVVSNITDSVSSSKNTTKNIKNKNVTKTNSNNKTEGNNEAQSVPESPSSKYPTDPTKPPALGYEWRGARTPGTGKGAWFKPKIGSSLRDDLKHPKPIGPHWDYKPTRNSPSYR